MLGLMLKRTHERKMAELDGIVQKIEQKLDTLEKTIIDLNKENSRLKGQLFNAERDNKFLKEKASKDDDKIINLLNNLNDAKQLIDAKDVRILRLVNRLSNTVEGLSDMDQQVLVAKKDNCYLYKVVCNSKTLYIKVPKTCTNYDNFAKLEAIKALGLKRDCLKGSTAVRITI